MQGNKSVIKLNPRRPPLEINDVQNTTTNKTGIFSTKRFITYTLGKRHLSLTITNTGSQTRINVVNIDLTETNGKGATANLNLRIIRNQRYGILCNMNTKLSGSYDSFKEHYNVPPLPDTELVCYVCSETGCGGCFTLEKKEDVVKATHAFVVDDDLVFSVKVRIREMGDRFSVEIEGPLKLTLDYTKQVISKIRGKMESEMESATNSLFHLRNVVPRARIYNNGDHNYKELHDSD